MPTRDVARHRLRKIRYDVSAFTRARRFDRILSESDLTSIRAHVYTVGRWTVYFRVNVLLQPSLHTPSQPPSKYMQWR